MFPLIHGNNNFKSCFYLSQHFMSLLKHCSYIGGLDVGTQSSRFVLFDNNGKSIIEAQKEIKSIYPKTGWIEQDPEDIYSSALYVMNKAVDLLKHKQLINNKNDIKNYIKAIGITNQRETTILWDKETGKPLSNAIVWKDNRCEDYVNEMNNSLSKQDKDFIKNKTGLLLSTYFSALKIKWLINNNKQVQESINKKTCMFGTVDSWLLWKLSNHSIHITDITNASRTLLCNIHSGQWDSELLNMFNIPSTLILPTIKSSSEEYCSISLDGYFNNIPITGCLGDQQAALLGNLCIKPGQAKNTYGTGCFLLYNTGEKPVFSNFGLLTTVAYQLGPKSPLIYALEGSISSAGSVVTWLKDNMKLINEPQDINIEAEKVTDSNGIYFVPAFNGLYAPRWRNDARGILVGLTGNETKSHLCRAILESICFQSKEIINAMNLDSNCNISILQVDGGMTKSDILLQIQSDILGTNIQRSLYSESTVLGAAIAAGLHTGTYNIEELGLNKESTIFKPQIAQEERDIKYKEWNKAVDKSLNWM